MVDLFLPLRFAGLFFAGLSVHGSSAATLAFDLTTALAGDSAGAVFLGRPRGFGVGFSSGGLDGLFDGSALAAFFARGFGSNGSDAAAASTCFNGDPCFCGSIRFTTCEASAAIFGSYLFAGERILAERRGESCALGVVPFVFVGDFAFTSAFAFAFGVALGLPLFGDAAGLALAMSE